MSREYELAVLASLIMDESGEYITSSEVNPDLFQLKSLAEKIVKYKNDGGTFDILLLQKAISDNALCGELIKTVGTISVNSARLYLQELKYRHFETIFFDKIAKGIRPTPEELRQGIELLNTHKIESNEYDFEKPVLKFIDNIYQDKQVYFKTQIKELDGMIGRILPDDGTLISLGGATGLGKTTLATRLLAQFILQDIPCLYMSCEMDFDSLFGKMCCQNSKNISAFAFRNHILNDKDKEEVKAISEQFYKKKAIIHVTGKFNIGEIKNSIKKHGSRIIFIDYVQMFRLDIMRGHTPASANAEIAKSVKDLANQTKTVIFALSQLNKMGDLRESAVWEDASSVVMKLFAKKRKTKKDGITVEEMCENHMEKAITLKIEKNRWGGVGDIGLLLNKTTTNLMPGISVWDTD